MSEGLLKNEDIREQLKNYLEKNMIKNRWVVKMTGLSDTSVSLFLSNQRDLKQEYLKMIYELLQ